MNPETRQLVQLTPDNMEDMISLYDIIMGSSSKNRRSFIVEHARQYQMVREDSEDEGDSEWVKQINKKKKKEYKILKH